MSDRSTAIVGGVVALLIVGAAISIGYYQVVVAPNLSSATSFSLTSTNQTGTAACSAGTCANITIIDRAASPPPGYNPNVEVLYGYNPSETVLVLGKNNTITWVNEDNAVHTATSTSGPQGFNSGNIPVGGSYSFTFGVPGTYHYHCIYHPWMIGVIVVRSG